MKTILLLMLILVTSICFAQEKEKTEKKKIIADSVFIPDRQMQKLIELDNAYKEIEKKREDILQDLLAVPENLARTKGKTFKGIRGKYLYFVKND